MATIDKARQLTISRLLNAPVELVWTMWSDPEHIKHWWGPKGFTNTIFKMDFRDGGEWDFIMHGPDGKDYPNKHHFKKIIPYKKLILQHATAPNFEMDVTFE